MATMSTKEVAAELETTPRTLRKFLRKIGAGVGQGSRYAVDQDDLETLRARYAAWLAAKVTTVEISEDEPVADAPDDEAPEA